MRGRRRAEVGRRNFLVALVLQKGLPSGTGVYVQDPVGGKPMNKETILVEIPACFKGVAEATAALVRCLGTVVREVGVGTAVEYGAIETRVAGAVAAVERAAHGDLLGSLEVDAPEVEIGGKRHRRIGRTMGHYKTLAGEVVMERSIYREVGVRNAPTVDPICKRIGAIGDGWTPEAARAMSYLMQQGTSREAETTSRHLGRLPYSRSSFDRVGHEIGGLLLEQHADIEDDVSRKFEIPKQATSVSASIDRVSLPMEEPRKRPVGRPRTNAPKRPVERNFRMAWCGTVTFHDAEGEALHTIRYGTMPHGDPVGMCLAMANEVHWGLCKRPGLELMLLADGAPDIWELLDQTFSLLEKTPHRLLDFWHVLEKLAPAAKAIHGEDGTTVLKAWGHLLRRRSSAAADILSELEASGCEESKFATERPVHEAITYLSNHGHRMNYAGARRRDLPIGSGNVEATCKSLVGTRMKRPGSRWKHETGEHIIHLRALALSDRWHEAMDRLMATQRTAVRIAA